LIAVLIIVAGFLTVGYAFHLFGGGQDCWVRPTAPAGSAVFTIVMGNEGVNVGFNGSKYLGGPVMNATVGQNVIMHVINNDTQAHGFQVVHYFDQGINGIAGLAPGKCFDVEFVAGQIGTFAVRCNIFCTIHDFMLSGILNVNP
jgi:heme/copper-type cytochrome/quinol oxidase subunit 2